RDLGAGHAGPGGRYDPRCLEKALTHGAARVLSDAHESGTWYTYASPKRHPRALTRHGCGRTTEFPAKKGWRFRRHAGNGRGEWVERRCYDCLVLPEDGAAIAIVLTQAPRPLFAEYLAECPKCRAIGGWLAYEPAGTHCRCCGSLWVLAAVPLEVQHAFEVTAGLVTAATAAGLPADVLLSGESRRGA